MFMSLELPIGLQVKKRGRISKHTTISNGKTYHRSKIYLSDSEFVGRKYDLMELDEIIVNSLGKKEKRKGFLIILKGGYF